MHVLIRAKPDRKNLELYVVDPLSGKERTRSAGTSDRGEAERAAALWQQEILAHRGARGDGWPLFRERFQDEHLAMIAPKSRIGYETALNHVQRCLKPSTVSDVASANVISAFQAQLVREGLELTSVANYLRHLKAALAFAERIGMISKAPAFKLPRTGKRKMMRGRPLTEAEYAKMLKLAETPEVRRFMELLWLSGLRLGEATVVSWDAYPIKILLEAKPHPQLVFHLEGQKARRDEVIPIVPDWAAWLRKTPKGQRRGLVAPLPLETISRISDLIGDIGEAAGIVVNDKGKFASAQDFRVSFGTRWARVVKPLTLMRLMRHASLETTMKYYIGLNEQDAGREVWNVPANVPKKGR